MNSKLLKSPNGKIIDRHFSIPTENHLLWSTSSTIKQLDEDIIGSESGFLGPFGWRNYVYVDHTASGKALKSVENFIKLEVLPHYANTHTTVSHTSSQTTLFRNEARDIIKKSVGATEDDEVIFCGAGCTAAVHKLVHHVNFPKQKKLIVFVGPFEHHSNILPWRETASKVIQVPMSQSTGYVDAEFLERNLKKIKQWGDKDQLIIGSFSAGSNVTGALTDDVNITEILHKYGALAFWDYAAAAPHIPVNMNPDGRFGNAKKDALFFSGHKFLGGPQTPGVLVVKKHVLQNPVPHGVGGGTVLYTTCKSQKYLSEIHEREEGGTPNIVGSIRLGLVFQVRNRIGIDTIMEKEAEYCRRALDAWAGIPEILVLGCTRAPRLPIISFMIQHANSGYYLHHNFVVALLNDLFGIQCRGGCMCAGPYGEVLLGIDGDAIVKLFGWDKKRRGKDLIAKFSTLLKPGFVRVSLNFHSSSEEVDFLIEAVKLIACHGWKLLPLYRICTESGSFVFNEKLMGKRGMKGMQLTSLDSFDPVFYSSLSEFPSKKNTYSELLDCLRDAEGYLTSPYHFPHSSLQLEMGVSPHPEILPSRQNNHAKKLRWFMIQNESASLQQDTPLFQAIKIPFIFKPPKLSFNEKPTWHQGSISEIVSRFWTPSRTKRSFSLDDHDPSFYWDNLYSNLRFSLDKILPKLRNEKPSHTYGKINYNETWEWKLK